VRTKKKRLKKEGKPTMVPEDETDMVMVYWSVSFAYYTNHNKHRFSITDLSSPNVSVS